MSETTATNWWVYVASCIGAHHLERDMPNQDSVRYAADGASAIVAIADGHGHHRHFRSGRGSDMATAVALAEMQRWLAANPPGATSDELSDSALAQLAPEIWHHWRAAVTKDVAENPFSESETSLRQADDPAEIAYGATLLVAAVNEAHTVLVQIGDGDIVAVTSGGRAWSPVPTDPALFGHRTTSLAQQDALKSFRVAVVEQTPDPLEILLLGTDGFANAQTDTNWPALVGTDIARMKKERGPEWVAKELPRWAQGCASKAGSGDDTTIALVMRETTDRRRGRRGGGGTPRRSRRIAGAIAIVALVAAGIAVGLSAVSRPAAIETTSSATAPPTTPKGPTTTLGTIATTTTPPTTTEIGANHARPLPIRNNGVEAIDPTSGRRVRVTFPSQVESARPRQAIQVGKFVLVLAGRQLWRVRISDPRARPAATPLLASPAPPLVSSRGRVTMPGRTGFVTYQVAPSTMIVRCFPRKGLPAKVCTGAIAPR